MSKSPAVAVEDEHAIESKSAAARAPAPAAVASAPAQRYIAHPSSERARSNKLSSSHKTSARATFPNPP
eukprot:3474573-Rhodomonas_salina.1